MTGLRGRRTGRRAADLRTAIGRRRPTSRTGWLKAVLAGTVAIGALAAMLAAAVLVVPVVYDEYGFHPEENARSWAALAPQYADAAVCRRCHAPEYAPWEASAHGAVTCEACHGPLAQHADSPGAAPAGTAVLEGPPAGLCVLCHEQSPARPITFAQVDLAGHFAGAPCLGCHDSHDASATTPPEISHALANLPACVTCHTPAGLKPVPAGHEEAADSVCQTCHKRPAGSE